MNARRFHHGKSERYCVRKKKVSNAKIYLLRLLVRDNGGAGIRFGAAH
jgi:hypothetical protein